MQDLEVFYVFFDSFLSRTVGSLSCVILINSVFTMQLALNTLSSVKNRSGKKSSDLKENSEKSQGKVREFHLGNLVRTLSDLFMKNQNQHSGSTV